MKKSIVHLVFLFLIAAAIPAMAQELVLPPSADKAIIEDNLFVGIASDNLGLQRSCALMLGKLQSNRAVIPLINILQNNSDETMRVAAAWALCNIGDVRGADAVQMATKADDCTKVRSACAWYYDNLVKQGTFTSDLPEFSTIATRE